MPQIQDLSRVPVLEKVQEPRKFVRFSASVVVVLRLIAPEVVKSTRPKSKTSVEVGKPLADRINARSVFFIDTSWRAGCETEPAPMPSGADCIAFQIRQTSYYSRRLIINHKNCNATIFLPSNVKKTVLQVDAQCQYFELFVSFIPDSCI